MAEQSNTKAKGVDEIYCPSCGSIIKKEAEICVRCGVRVKNSPAIASPTVPKSKATAVVLAVFLGFWTWCYTYKKNSSKFWVSLILSLVTFGVFGIIAWVWAIIDTATKPQEYYAQFPL